MLLQIPTDPVDLLLFILTFIIFLLLLTIVLKLALGFVDKAKHENFGSVFVTCLIIVVAIAIVYIIIPNGIIALVVGLIIMWLIISARHNTGFVTAIGVSILALIIAFVLLWLITLVLAALNITLVAFF